MTEERTSIGMLPPDTQTANGKITAAPIEARETYLLRRKITIHVTSVIPNATGASATKTPALVAIPFPPLKRSQQV